MSTYDFNNSSLTSFSGITFTNFAKNIKASNNSLNNINGLPTDIETLDIANNPTLSFSNLSNFSIFSNLVFLTISNCKITSLNGLPTYIVVLDVSYNLIEDLSPLSNCSNLYNVNISHNLINSIDVELSSFLCYLNLSYNLLISLNNISYLTNISKLNVSNNNELTSLGNISSLINLLELNVSNTSITDFSQIPSKYFTLIVNPELLINANTITNSFLTIVTQDSLNFNNIQKNSNILNFILTQSGTFVNNKNNTWLTLGTTYYPGSTVYLLTTFTLCASTNDITNGTIFRVQDVTNNKTIIQITLFNQSKKITVFTTLSNIPPSSSTFELQARRGSAITSSNSTIFSASFY